MFRIVSALAFFALGFLLVATAPGEEPVRVTVTMNPDGSKTVYQTDGTRRESIATTTSAKGKQLRRIVYQLDAAGRFEAAEVFGPDGAFRFKSAYQYDAAGRLAQETQLSKDGATRHRIVYRYEADGRPAGYAIYDGPGNLLGRTSARAAPSSGPAPAKSR